MKNVTLLGLGLSLILGLFAWRIRGPHDEAFPAPSPALPPAHLAMPSVPSGVCEETELGRVGSQVLTATRLARWKSIGELRSGGSSPDGDAILFLEQSLKREIAERTFGLRPSAADLETLLRKLASDPEEQASLARIEALFKGDHRAFLEEVIAPVFVETELWNRFRNDPEIHRAARRSAEEFASRAQRDPRQFPTQGPPDGAFGRGLIARDAAAKSPDRNPLPRLDGLPVDPGALAQVSMGQIYPGVLDTPDAYVVLRVDRQRPGFTEVQTWSVAKVSYVPWLTEKGRELSWTIDSPELKAKVDALEPAHWLRQVFR